MESFASELEFYVSLGYNLIQLKFYSTVNIDVGYCNAVKFSV